MEKSIGKEVDPELTVVRKWNLTVLRTWDMCPRAAMTGLSEEVQLSRREAGDHRAHGGRAMAEAE